MNKHPGLLVGVRKIRNFCGVGTDTLYRWVEHYEFPVTRFPSEKGEGYWVTSPLLIEDWLKTYMRPIPSQKSGEKANTV